MLCAEMYNLQVTWSTKSFSKSHNAVTLLKGPIT